MTVATDDFEVLHAVRLRGVVSSEALAAMLGAGEEEIGAALQRLEIAGSVFHRQGRRVSGWALTEEGRAHHAEQLRAWSAAQPVDELARVYDSFLDLNGRFKALCARWQHLDSADDAERWKLIGTLSDFHGEAAAVFDRAGALIPRFARYSARLADAEQRVAGGDERFFTGMAVESYHTIWFEAHEDFLLALGRDRATEGSF